MALRHHGEEFPDVSSSRMASHLYTTMVGFGIVALPVSLKHLGVIPGILMIVAGAVIADRSIDMILRYGRASGNATYAGVVLDSFGTTGARLLQVSIVLYNLGVLVVYVTVIGDVLAGTWSDGVHHSGMAEELFGQHWWTKRYYLLLLIKLFVFAPLISFKRVDLLMNQTALPGRFACVSVSAIAGVALLKVAAGHVTMPPMMPEVVDGAFVWKLFTTVPVIAIAYICHHNVRPVESELQNPAKTRSIVGTSLALSLLLYSATSFFAILLFGEHVLDNVLANFDGDLGIPCGKLINNVVRASYCIHVMLVFPIIFLSLRLNVVGLLSSSVAAAARDNWISYPITITFMGFILRAATLVPNISDAFQILGSTAAVIIGFIFPAAIAIRDTHGIATTKDKVASWLMIVLGTLSVLSSRAPISNIHRSITA